MPSFRSPDGLLIATRHSPGRPEVVFAHATGFCKEVWGPVAGLLPGCGVLAIDQRGHGHSGVGAPPFDWWDLAGDVLAGIDEVGWDQPIGVGHSSGAASLLMAEILRPGTFAALILIEPIVFPPPYVRFEELPLALTAERRRPAFSSREAARDAYRGRGPFARWTDEALDAYLDGGFEDRDGEWVLRCGPATEAECYRTATLHGAWDRLGEVTCPAVVVGGEDSDSHPHQFIEEQAARLGGEAKVEIVAGATHFVPMEQPDVIAALIEDLSRR